MRDFWNDLREKKTDNNLDAGEKELFNKLIRTIRFLRDDPKYPGLKTHEIKNLSNKYGMKIWQSYSDQGQKAQHLFWTYGPERKEITILGIEPHSENKRGSYKRIKLSNFPK